MKEDNLSSPAAVLKQAIKAVPAVKYALGIGGIVGVIAIISSFKIGLQVALLGTIVMLVLMTVLVLFAHLTTHKTSGIHFAALTFTWCCLALFMAVAVTFFISVFWGKPADLRNLIGVSSETYNERRTTKIEPKPGATIGPMAKTTDTPTIPKKGSSKIGSMREKQKASDDWENRGDDAAKDAIAEEYRIHQPGYQPTYSATENPSTPYKRINQSWKEADNDWQEALAIAADEHRTNRLKLKLSHDKGKTCSDEKTENVFCYINGTNANVLVAQGTRKVVSRH
jgi:hypothetical protein